MWKEGQLTICEEICQISRSEKATGDGRLPAMAEINLPRCKCLKIRRARNLVNFPNYVISKMHMYKNIQFLQQNDTSILKQKNCIQVFIVHKWYGFCRSLLLYVPCQTVTLPSVLRSLFPTCGGKLTCSQLPLLSRREVTSNCSSNNVQNLTVWNTPTQHTTRRTKQYELTKFFTLKWRSVQLNNSCKKSKLRCENVKQNGVSNFENEKQTKNQNKRTVVQQVNWSQQIQFSGANILCAVHTTLVCWCRFGDCSSNEPADKSICSN